MYDLTDMDSFLSKLDRKKVQEYKKYWKRLTPKTSRDYYLRFIFAFLSIQTTWLQNVRAFLQFWTLPKDFTQEELKEALVESGSGMHDVKSKFMYAFSNNFWKWPENYYPRSYESMTDCRNRLMINIDGLGYAKTAFALELAYPETCDVACLDRHMLDLFKYDKNKNTPKPSEYLEMEEGWRALCAKHKIPCPIARHLVWDNKQEKRSTQYWSLAFEVAK